MPLFRDCFFYCFLEMCHRTCIAFSTSQIFFWFFTSSVFAKSFVCVESVRTVIFLLLLLLLLLLMLLLILLFCAPPHSTPGTLIMSSGDALKGTFCTRNNTPEVPAI